jgi:thiol:disulfide interchange protein DsbA
MKNTILLSITLLAIAACGQEEPAQPEPGDPVVVEEVVTDESAETMETVEEAEATVVEESAAEPEGDEQTIMLAQADTPAVAQEWQFQEGKNYIRLVPTQPTVGGADKIEVAEFFYYLCPHCYNFEPLIKEWAANKPANTRFVQVPAMWNQVLVLHGRMFYTAEILARNGVIADADAFNTAVYQEIHVRNNKLGSEGAIQKLFERFNVSASLMANTGSVRKKPAVIRKCLRSSTNSSSGKVHASRYLRPLSSVSRRPGASTGA